MTLFLSIIGLTAHCDDNRKQVDILHFIFLVISNILVFDKGK